MANEVQSLAQMSKSNGTTSSVSVGLVSTAVVGSNTARSALLLGAPVANRVTISTAVTAVLDAGINLYPGGPFLMWSAYTVGAFIQNAFTGITVVGAQTIGIADISIPLI